MYARMTMFHVDPKDINLDIAQGVFERLVVPEMRKQPGYEGCYLLRTEHGRGAVVSLWESEDAAISSETSGYYAEQLAKLMPLLGRSPGVDTFRVAFADHPIAEG